MASYHVRLKGSQEIASGTMAFHLEKPEGFTYKAGQTCDLTLIDPAETDAEGNRRAFTFASAPYEPDLIVATRMRDTAFKRVLKSLKPGSELKLDAPFGSFTLHSDAALPAVFLAGGIGITPARSIVLQATHSRLPHRIFLFDSNRTPAEAAFLNDFLQATTQNPNFTFVGTMTAKDQSKYDWSGETGHLSKEMLARSIPDLNLPIYYISGPRAMVAAMCEMLEAAGVKDDKVRTEEFSGY